MCNAFVYCKQLNSDMYKQRNIVLVILIYNLCIWHCINGNPESANISRWRSYPSLLNLNFTTEIVWSTVSENVAFCARLCEDDTRCTSFGYHNERKTCQGQSNKQYNPNLASATLEVMNFCPLGTKFDIEFVNGSSRYMSLEPMLAVDGDFTNFYGTAYETDGFPHFVAEWTIPILVTEVIVYKRSVTVLRFQNVFVYVGMKNETLEFCDVLIGSYSDLVHRFVCSYPIKGNTVKLEHRGPKADTAIPAAGFEFRILEIAEILMYGFQ